MHTIKQGEGGEQGDAMMPLLFSLGQHSALLKVQEQLHEGEFLLAFLDDIYSHHARAREGGAQGLGREFVVRVGNSCPPRINQDLECSRREAPRM